jgi:hypothetical protein
MLAGTSGREVVEQVKYGRRRKFAGVLLVLFIACGCAGNNRVTSVPASPSGPPTLQVIADLKAYEKRVGFEPTGNFAAASGEAFPGRCYYTGLLELPESYRELHLTALVNGKCSVSESEYDVFAYPLETAATGKSAITPALESAALERVLMVVPHEDFHNQPEMRAAPPEAAEAAATLVGFLTAAGFARDANGPDAQLFGRMSREAAEFRSKAAIINDYYGRVADLYASYRAGVTGREEALARKRKLFDGLRAACSALEPPPASFNRCPAVMNNAGLAFDRTYTREYPVSYDLYIRLGGDLKSTIAALRRLLPRWPAAARSAADLIDALRSAAP